MFVHVSFANIWLRINVKVRLSQHKLKSSQKQFHLLSINALHPRIEYLIKYKVIGAVGEEGTLCQYLGKGRGGRGGGAPDPPGLSFPLLLVPLLLAGQRSRPFCS